MDNNKICVNALIVTYNRVECLLKLIAGLESQTHEINTIIIIDNNSTDSTYEKLSENGYITKITHGSISDLNKNNIRFVYYLQNENLGGAGGFSKGVELALRYSCDYVWIMDDDVLPESNCLERMLYHASDGVKAFVPNRTDENFDDSVCIEMNLHSVMKFDMCLGKRKKYINSPFDKETYYTEHFPFEGPLIAYDVIKNVGLPFADYFIFRDDTEYSVKVRKITKILFVTNACLHRQLAKRISINTDKKQKPKKHFTWRDYYSLRNDVIFLRRCGETFGVRYISPLLEWVYLFLLLIYKRRFKDIKILNKAMVDGLRGRLGKQVEPGSF